MKKTITFLIFIIFQLLSIFIFSNQEDSRNFDRNLQNEFFEMCKKEQELRSHLIKAMNTIAEKEWEQKVAEIDDLHLIRLQKVIEDYGWPGYSLVGSEWSHAFWLLVQHTPDDIFQSKCLELLEQAVIEKDASPIDLAYLKDRVYVYAGKKQIYGTQLNQDMIFFPIEDEEHVNERRLAIGLSTLEEYMALIKELYTKD